MKHCSNKRLLNQPTYNESMESYNEAMKTDYISLELILALECGGVHQKKRFAIFANVQHVLIIKRYNVTTNKVTCYMYTIF